MSKTTTYGYARVSTDHQSVDSQLLALEKAGVLRANVETDDATSGTVPALERPGVQSLLATAKRGDTVAVYSLSRAGRSTLDVLALLALLESRGIFFRSLTENLETSTPVGRLLVTMLAAFAQMEREMTVERTKAGLAVAKAKGKLLGRAETPGRREAVGELLAAGMTVAQIASELGLPYNSCKRQIARIRATEATGPAF